MPLAAANALAAVCLVSVAIASPSQAAGPTPLNSSVLLLDERRLEACEWLVDRAALTGGGRVQIVVNLHVRLDEALRIQEWGLLRDRRRPWTNADNFRPLDGRLVDEFEAQLTAAMRRARMLGLEVAILPHLDAAGRVQAWRNGFDFDPLEVIAGHSYRSAMIEPIARAISRASPAADHDKRVWLALSGEMGRSLFQNPGGYHEMLVALRDRLRTTRVEIGVSLNHTDIGDGHPLTYDQRQQLQTLLEACDFIGVSCYRPFEPPAAARHFSEAVQAFRDEFTTAGLRLPERAALHFSEVGFGGAPDESGRSTPAAAAAEPWEGASLGRPGPWGTPEMTRIRREYYTALLKFLSGQSGGEPEAAFLWSEGSWEPMGVDQMRFADRLIIREVLRHNHLAEAATQRP